MFGGGDSNLYGYVLGDPVDFVDPDGLAPTGKWINCGGGCRIRIDNNHVGSGRHIHWECKNGRNGACGENNTLSHGTDCSTMPNKVKKCAKKHGFNPDKKPSNDFCEIENPIPSPPWWLLPVRIIGVGTSIVGAVLAP